MRMDQSSNSEETKLPMAKAAPRPMATGAAATTKPPTAVLATALPIAGKR